MTPYIKITDNAKLKTSELLNKCRDQFPVWCYLDDKELDKQFPKPKKTTTRYFLKTQEPDEDLRNKSAEDLEEEGIEGITLRERIIMELEYFKETGKHLDIDNVTLCAGSRRRGGSVPSAYWGGVRSDVGWYYASDRDPHLGARRAFNSLPLPLVSLDEAVKVCKEAGYKVIKEL